MKKRKIKKLTYEELHRQLNYDHLTGVFRWKISNTIRVKIGDIAGCKNTQGYISIGIDELEYKAHRLAWFYTYGYMPENGLDHKDRIKHHNWILNLREVSQQCNIRNTGNFSHNTSGIKGVYWNKIKNKWYARVAVDRKGKHLGYFKDFDEAVCHRLAAEQCLNWSACDSNSPALQYVKDHIQTN